MEVILMDYYDWLRETGCEDTPEAFIDWKTEEKIRENGYVIKNRNYNRRKELVDFWTIIRNISNAIAVIAAFFMVGWIELHPNRSLVVAIFFVIFAIISYSIERYCINELCEDDIRFNTVFYHPDYDLYSEYFDWLYDHGLKDTDNNYNEYLREEIFYD